MQNGARRLILFDVDGTLISTRGVAGRALAQAISEVIEVEVQLDGYRLAGKTDPQIIFELTSRAGVPRARVTPRLHEVIEAYLARLDGALQPECVTVLPGVHDALSALSALPGVRIGLLTGNVQSGANLKLSRAGIAHFFGIGAYGSDEEDRNRLVPVARARAESTWGESFPGQRAVVVGDAEADIRCARAGGARSIAVATGGTPEATLATLQPDALFASMADPGLLPALLGGPYDPD